MPAPIGPGVLWLGVRLRAGPGQIVGEAISLLLMTAGIVSTAHHALQVADRAVASGLRR